MDLNSQTSTTADGRKRTTPDHLFHCEEHSPDLLQGCYNLWKQRILCDGTLIVGTHHIAIHKVVLASCSEYFRVIFTENESIRELQLNSKITKEGIELVLEYIYTSKITLTLGNIKTVLNTALLLRIPKLIGLCAKYLMHMVNLDNCVNILQLSNMFQHTEFQQLRGYTQDFIADNFVKVAEKSEFQKLTAEELTNILSQDRVETTSEFQLFKIAAKWIMHKREERVAYAPAVMKNIRFPLIKSQDLVDHVQSYDFMFEQEECHQYLLQALNYHLIPQRQHSFQTPRNRFRSSNDVMVSVGGELPNHKVSDDVLVFDESRSAWKLFSTMPLKRVDHCIAVLNDFMYVAGGQVTLNSNGKESIGTLHRFDPRLNSWLQMCPMQQRRAFFYLGACEGVLYAVGGKNEQGALASAEVYEPTKNRWKFIASLSKPTYALAGSILGGQMHVCGGFSNRTFLKSFLVYDKQHDEWLAKRPMCNARGFHMMCALKECVYVMGGNQLSVIGERVDVSSVEKYSPEIDEWITISPMLCGLSMAGITTIDQERIFVVGGYNGQNRLREKEVYGYNVAEDEWDILGELPEAGLRMACCTLVLPRSIFRDGSPDEQSYDSSFLSDSQVSLSQSVASTVPR